MQWECEKITEKCVVSKYGTKRMSIPVPRSLEGEIRVGDELEAVVDRKHKLIIYRAKNSDIKPPESFNIEVELE